MTAQPVEHPARLPRIKFEVPDIRRHLPTELLPQFQQELDAAVEAADMVAAVTAFKLRWHTQALAETNPKLMADLQLAAAGRLEFVPSPLAR